MTFNDFISSFYMGKNDGDSVAMHNLMGYALLNSYIGASDFFDEALSYFFIGSLAFESGRLFCTIGDRKTEMPNEVTNQLKLDDEEFKNINLSKLWEVFNDSESYSLTFPFKDEKKNIYFLYDLTLKSLINCKKKHSFSDFQRQYPVLYAIIKSIQLDYLNKENMLYSNPMAKTAMVISHTLNLCKLPNLEIIHSLLNTKYEGKNIVGTVLFSEESSPDCIISFIRSQPILMSEIRALRKYFQMVGDKMTLVAKLCNNDSEKYAFWSICGVGNNPNYYAKLSFDLGNRWRLQIKNEEIGFDGSGYFARLVEDKYNYDKLFDSLLEVCEYTEAGAMRSVVDCLCMQKHGTMLLIYSIAREEASRLGALHRAIEIDNCQISQLTNEELIAISSIDGCILSTPNGICTAFGAILDGEAKISTDIARGARYNSALTYLKKMKDNNEKAVAVIISEDGSLDIVSTSTIDFIENY